MDLTASLLGLHVTAGSGSRSPGQTDGGLTGGGLMPQPGSQSFMTWYQVMAQWLGTSDPED